MEEAERCTGVIVQEGPLRGYPSKRGGTHSCLDTVDTVEQSGEETPLIGTILPEWSQSSLEEARGDKW
jgi:hypothetical protein